MALTCGAFELRLDSVFLMFACISVCKHHSACTEVGKYCEEVRFLLYLVGSRIKFRLASLVARALHVELFHGP